MALMAALVMVGCGGSSKSVNVDQVFADMFSIMDRFSEKAEKAIDEYRSEEFVQAFEEFSDDIYELKGDIESLKGNSEVEKYFTDFMNRRSGFESLCNKAERKLSLSSSQMKRLENAAAQIDGF